MDTNTIIGAVLGFLGSLIISYFFYRKSLKQKKLSLSSESTVLISESLNEYENLIILYNGNEIKSLVSTKIRIQNVGSDTIEPPDFVNSSPLKITTNEKFLLQDVSKYKIYCTQTKTTCSLERVDDKNLKVLFDFLNPKEDIVVTVLHTGQISVSGDLKNGSVKNATPKIESKPALRVGSSYSRINRDIYFEREDDVFPSYFNKMLIMLMVSCMYCVMLLYFFYPNGRQGMDSEMMILTMMGMMTIMMTILFHTKR